MATTFLSQLAKQGLDAGGGLPGAQRTLLTALCLPSILKALEPLLSLPLWQSLDFPAELQGVEGSEWFLP